MITAIIPAKGTSQRIPQKNFQLVGRESLVDRAITFAERITEIKQIIVSTDSSELVRTSQHLSNYVAMFDKLNQNEVLAVSARLFIHKRTDSDAQRETKTINVVKSIHKNFSPMHKNLLLLQPTSPFRLHSEFHEILRIYQGGEYGVFSVKKVDSPHPLKTFEIDSNQIPTLTQALLKNLASPAQQLPIFYAPDGAYYLNSLESLLRTGLFIDDNSRIFIRDPRFTINIDTPEDLIVAQSLAPILDEEN